MKRRGEEKTRLTREEGRGRLLAVAQKGRVGKSGYDLRRTIRAKPY